MSAEENDLRATLESAFNDNSEAGGSSENTPEPVRTSTETTTGEPRTAAPGEDRGDGRRVDGKFARQKPSAAPADGSAAPGGVPDPALAKEAVKPEGEQQRDPFAKAPQSWKPGAREVWAQLPADVRAEVHRREKETARIVQETAQARQVTDYVSKLQQQFAPALQAEGVDALTASANLMNLASRLRFGTPVEKAQLAATIVRNYGVDVNALADALDRMPPGMGQIHGQPFQQPQHQQQMMTDPRVDQLLAQLQGLQQQRQEQVVQKAVEEVETFGSDKEFFEDVREDMADLLEVAARRGIDLSLEQAYERACKMQPDIAKVLEAREAAKQAGNLQGSTQRAKRAASSVRGTPSGVPSSNPADLRGAIEAAFEQVGGR
jgi:hypothetical protein